MEGISNNLEKVAETLDGADNDKKSDDKKISGADLSFCHPVFLSFKQIAMEHLSPLLLSPWRSQLRRSQLHLSPLLLSPWRSQLHLSPLLLSPWRSQLRRSQLRLPYISLPASF